MALYDEMTSNEKYAISNLMDGIITFIREAKYQPSDEEIIAMMIKIYYDNNGYLNIDDIIDLIKQTQ
jgi:hypothetical protein